MFAGRNFVPYQAIERDTKELFLKTSSNGSGTYTIANGVGIYSVTKTDTGVTRIYLEDKYPALKSVKAIVLDSTVRHFDFQVKAHDVAPTSGRAYIDLFSLSAGSETDLTASTVLVKIVLKNTESVF